MPRPDQNDRPETANTSIDDGDLAARAGEWSDAIAIWERNLGGDQQTAASRRIRWFLEESTSGRTRSRIPSDARRNGPVLLLVALGCGLVGTALVLIAESQSGATRLMLASAAWLLYISAAILAVTYAFQSGRTAVRVKTLLSPGEVDRARRLAASIDASGDPTLADLSSQVVRR